MKQKVITGYLRDQYKLYLHCHNNVKIEYHLTNIKTYGKHGNILESVCVCVCLLSWSVENEIDKASSWTWWYSG